MTSTVRVCELSSMRGTADGLPDDWHAAERVVSVRTAKRHRRCHRFGIAVETRLLRKRDRLQRQSAIGACQHDRARIVEQIELLYALEGCNRTTSDWWIS